MIVEELAQELSYCSFSDKENGHWVWLSFHHVDKVIYQFLRKCNAESGRVEDFLSTGNVEHSHPLIVCRRENHCPFPPLAGMQGLEFYHTKNLGLSLSIMASHIRTAKLFSILTAGDIFSFKKV